MNRLLLVFIAVLAQLLSLQSARGRFLLENDSSPSPSPVAQPAIPWLPFALISPFFFVVCCLLECVIQRSNRARAIQETIPDNVVPVLPPPELIITESDRFKFHDRIHDLCCVCLELNIEHSSTCSTDELSISVTETTPSNIELPSSSSMTEQPNSQLDTLTDHVTSSQSKKSACLLCDETGLDSICKMPCGQHFIHKDCTIELIRVRARGRIFPCPECRATFPTSRS